MGISGLFESVKNWTVARLAAPKPDLQNQRFPNLGEDIQKVLHAPEFEHVLSSASPFLMASLGAWPGYWLYRGFDYHSHKAYVPLPTYIRQTFYQAKLLQFVILMVGIMHIVRTQRSASNPNDD